MQKAFWVLLFFIFSAEAALLFFYILHSSDSPQDVIAINEVLHSVQDNWGSPEHYESPRNLDYVLLDTEGSVLFRTKEGLTESIYQAVRHRDTILDIQYNGSPAGKIIFYNNTGRLLQEQRRKTALGLFLAFLLQWGISIGLLFYLNHSLLRPFRKLEAFAQRIAGGNLDIPLEMDRHNFFGAFTESFDLMRSELKRARIAEAKANISKKELVAKLSHDIRTPVASIKAAAEVGAVLVSNLPDSENPIDGSAEPLQDFPADKRHSLQKTLHDNYTQIIRKADQINALVTDLFTATLEELQQLPVTPTALESRELKVLLENADYLHKAVIPPIPDCILYGDRLRLQQVFDNLFANSYKYAGTKIDIELYQAGNLLAVSIEDYGGGVKPEELPLLKEKFKRGSSGANREGAGLGLYISDYFMKEMQGALNIENGRHGLKVTVEIQNLRNS